MSAASIELLGSDVLCSIAGGGETRLPSAPALAKLRDWSQRYDKASRTDNEGALSDIGREMFAWLDDAGWASNWANGAGDRGAIRVAGAGGADEETLLDAPWELLSRADGPLALDDIRLFIVARRIGAKAAPVEPRRADLQLMFMAAAPEGQTELDFEGEEAAILEATKRLPIRVIVEETGSLEFLGPRLNSDEGPFEALHLSCHGDIDRDKGPILLLEEAAGGEVRVGPGELARALGADPPPLVVLSACRTAERGGAAAPAGGPGRRDPAGEWRDGGSRARATGPELATPFVRRLAARIANLIGWDGSVYDADAIDFAKYFYEQLAGRSSVPRAAAVARQALLREKTAQRGRHWHLARVYLGPGGGGPLCAQGKPKRKAVDGDAKVFLDKARRVPVATRAEFVGRRRAIQSVLRAFRDAPNGVLIHGMGALGKSSLAARVQNRMPTHRPAVIFERYDALAIFDEVLEALDAKIRLAEKAQWRDPVKANSALLADALESWLAGPLDAAPILMIVDDLERILETPSQSDAATGVAATWRPALAAVLIAFDRASTRSRLLMTSRYDFRLPDGKGGDRAEGLVRVPLKPMAPRERLKQWRAAERVAGRDTAELDEAATALLGRALEAAAGNPGLQAILTRPILAGELAAAEKALGEIDVFRRTGAPPKEIAALIEAGTAKDSDNALTAFFARVSFATYRAALTPDQARQLSAATLFTAEIPIQRSALAASGAALGVEAPESAIGRLLGLGLFDDWGTIGAVPHAAANPLARPLAEPLDADDRPRLARAALSHLVEPWRNPDGWFSLDPRAIEAARLALEAGAEPAILEDTALAGAMWLERVEGQTRQALALIASAFAAFPVGHAASPQFLRLGVECADRLGEAALLDALLAAPVKPPNPGDLKARLSHAHFDLRRAGRLIRTGRMGEAEALTRDALATAEEVGDDGTVAFAFGQIADILRARGDLDEAERIRREEQLLRYERLGDVRERAIVIGKIADILQSRGDLDEALRIRREEQLPVFERLGDVREHALTMGEIADILESRGNLDEALRIRREEELPIYERLGDVRSRAVTMGKIADTLQSRGNLAGALRIRREEQLPVFERLGEVRERAVTMGKIADVLQSSGDLKEALRIRREQLPIFERLGDVRERAVTMGRIADIHQAHGDVNEALRVLHEEALPAFDHIGDVRSRSAILQRIAAWLLDSGGLEQGRIHEIFEALAESFAIARKLGATDGVARVGVMLAQVMAMGGSQHEALEVLDEAEAAHERLGDADGVAHVHALRQRIAAMQPPSPGEGAPS